MSVASLAAARPAGLDFNRTPFLVIWETTRACDLACVHCRANADPQRSPDELDTLQAMKLIDDVQEMGTPVFVFTGGDPLKREDLERLIRHAKGHGLRVGAIPAVTPALTRERLTRLAASGLDQVAFSLDSADSVEHEQLRRAPGVYARTLEAARQARELGMSLQINSLVNVHNIESFQKLADLVVSLDVVFWEIFFLVPTGRGSLLPVLSANRFRAIFEKIHAVARTAPFIVKVTEAPHYRRFVAEAAGGSSFTVPAMPAELTRRTGPMGSIGNAPHGVNAGKGFLFVSHEGAVYPSGFLPVAAGSVKEKSLSEIYRQSPLFRALRDSAQLKGRCGVCHYRDLCGGSRARAWAMTGDYLAEDPCCFYDQN